MKKDLQQLFNEYTEYCTYSKRLRAETIRGYKETFRHFTAMMPEISAPEALSIQAMNQFFKILQLRKRTVGVGTEKIGVKDSTIRTYWSKLNSFFEWLAVNKVILENPLSKIKPPEVVYDDLPALNRGDIEKIYAAATLHAKNPLMLKRDIAMISVLFFTGARKTELISLQIRDIDIQKGNLIIRGETSKSKRTRQVPINPVLLLHLKNYLSDSARKSYKTQNLFVSNNKDVGLSSHGLKHWVKRLNELSGVRFHLHQFRHTFACNLARGEISVFRLQRLMGHTDIRMTERYLRSLTPEDLRGDIDRLTIDNLV